MDVTTKTSELAILIANQFEQTRLKAEEIDPELGRHKFIIEPTDSNVISIQVPEVIQVDHYTDRIFSIVDSIMVEAKYEVTEPIKIKIYGPDRMQLDELTFYPTFKQNVTIIENEMETEEPFEVVIKDQAYLVTPLEDCTFDISIGTNRIGNIRHHVEHEDGPLWVSDDLISEKDVEAIGYAIEMEER
ncbi:MAG: hypothetical protein WKF66_02080 [Pedobacter sp.]